MGHVTFIHGIGNKPRTDELLEQWRVALLDDDGVDLDELDATASMVYWADLLYEAPAPAGAATEATSFELEQGTDPEDADLTWLNDVPDQERAFVEQLAEDVGFAAISADANEGNDPIRPGTPLEAVPLPAFLKRRLMRVLLRDVHHYLYDAAFSPRPGESYRIRQEVRGRALGALTEGARQSPPHVVVGHSLGTVIGYDALTGMDDAPRVDALLTLGSPLGISEVQERLAPPWTRANGWPSRLGNGPWCNIYDPLDPVCGVFDRVIGGDYRRDGTILVRDISVSNTGSWRHAIGKYLGQSQVRDWLHTVFEDPSGASR
jgi:hypothetical protein